MKQQPLKIGCIFEGPTDRHVIPVLVSQLLKQPIELIPLRKTSSGWHDFKRPSPQDLRAGRRRPRWGMFQSYVKSLVIAGAEVIVVVADHDADEDIGHAEPFPHKRWCMLGQHVPFDTQPHLCLIDAARRAVMCQDHRLGPPCFPDCVTDVYKPDQLLVIIGIAKQMLEAWLLAQPDVVETVLWARLSAQDRARCQTPEAIPPSCVMRHASYVMRQ